MNSVPASIRRMAAEQTLELPFRVPPQQWFTLREAGELLGIAESTVERLYDAGELTGHSHNAARGERIHKRILRSSLLAYAMRTADYDDASIEDAFVTSVRPLSPARLLRLSERIRQLAQHTQRQLAG